MYRITEHQTSILEALARYGYLTASQLKAIGVSTDLKSIQRMLRVLQDVPNAKKPVIDAIRYPTYIRIQNTEWLWFLTEQGSHVLADILQIDATEIQWNKPASDFARQYWHRHHTVDFWLFLNKTLEQNPSWGVETALFQAYFHKTGANHRTKNEGGALRALTRIDWNEGNYIIPDANFVLYSAKAPEGEKHRLFSLEVTEGKRTKRTLQQIKRHTYALKAGAMAERYNVQKNYKVLCFFDQRADMELVRERFPEVPNAAQFQELFFFACIDDALAGDFLRCWMRPKAIGEDRFYNFISGKQTDFKPISSEVAATIVKRGKVE